MEALHLDEGDGASAQIAAAMPGRLQERVRSFASLPAFPPYRTATADLPPLPQTHGYLHDGAAS